MVVKISEKVEAGEEAVKQDINLLGGNLNLRVEAQGTPNTTAKVKAGIGYFSEKDIVEITDTNSTGIGSAVTNPRIDLLSLSSTGGITVTAGAENASPVRPAIPTGELALADIYVRTSTGSLVVKNEDDSTNHYIRQDLRPGFFIPKKLLDGSNADDLHIHTAGNLLDSSNTDVSLSNTNETTLYSFSLPANTLGTDKGIRIRVPLSVLEVTATKTQTIRLKYGSTTLATVVMDEAIDTGWGGFIEAELFANAATDAQFGFVTVGGGAGGGTESAKMMSDDGTATEDSTGALTVAITAQRNQDDANNDLTSIGGYTHRL